jgi:uroporphyrinogen III methyltransferase / synthase
VVGLRDKLNWFERLPLFGQRIVVTRARGQADALSSRLRALGADVDRIADHRDSAALDYGAARPGHRQPRLYDWLIFTSANGVRFSWSAWTAPPWTCARCGRASAPSVRPRAPPSKRCT